MQPNGWNKRIGKSGWSFLTVEHDADDVANILTKLYELGWRGPEIAPVINPEGTAVLWKSPDSQGIPVLTSEGLLSFYQEKGHRWFMLRVDQLLRGCAGPLAARLQEVFAQYEEQCKSDGIEAVPEWLDYDIVVGGENATSGCLDAQKFVAGMREE
jgi:hypothetical protein